MIAGVERWILAVEDNPSDMALLRLALGESQESSWLRTVRNGEDAVRLLTSLAADRDSLPDVVLLDLNLPRMDGYQVLNELRSNDAYRDVTVLILTTSDSEMDRRRALKGGADGFFSKPFDLATYEQLPTVIQHARERRKEHIRGGRRGQI